MKDEQEPLIIFIQNNQEKLYRFAYRYMGNSDLAMDALQEAIIKGITKYHKLKNPAYMKTWFYRILINECKNMFKRFPIQSDTYLSTIEDQHEKDPLLTLTLEEMIAHLNDTYRDIIYLHHYEDCTFKEISKILHLHESTVKSRYYKGIGILKNRWEGKTYE